MAKGGKGKRSKPKSAGKRRAGGTRKSAASRKRVARRKALAPATLTRLRRNVLAAVPSDPEQDLSFS